MAHATASLFHSVPPFYCCFIRYYSRAILLPKSNVNTFVFGLELLDNLGHDKIRRAPNSLQMEQAEVVTQKSKDNDGSDHSSEEVFVPLRDSLLQNMVRIVPSYSGTSSGAPAWIPSVAGGVLTHCLQQRPRLQLVLADFDYLPRPDVQLGASVERISELSYGEPLVTDMDGVDHECYLQSPYLADILFPTDFDKLARFLKNQMTNITKKRRNNQSRKRRNGREEPMPLIQTEKQSTFLRRYGSDQVRETKSWLTGYSPLTEDFGNCTVLTMTR